ncbi:hypothetical protein [Streptomyces triticirhizae]|uniref:hypothetical protein n=1 Tax=Streptomyces triticirhizae TaxID=2483353 RepID=UPI0011C3EF81|nr:hypothetical protein [Streptomyces triticirhizae]
MARRLVSSGDDMRNAARELAGTDASRLGTSELTSRCEDFADSWDYGFGQLSDLTSGIGDVANNAADTLTATDEELEATIRNANQG